MILLLARLGMHKLLLFEVNGFKIYLMVASH